MSVGRYIDLQVNGYGGVDFNTDGLTADGLRRACEAMRRDGVASILATIITDSLDAMAGRLRRLVELREADELAGELIVGLHVEGPFLNERDGFRGAHPLDAIRPADADAMRRLLEAGGGLVRYVTLAPERDAGMRVTRMLTAAGVAVAAGHSDASLDELDAAADAGLSLYTHLGNGCPMQTHRHDNIVQRVLSRVDRIRPTFIADGVHVPFFALRNYIRLAGVDGCIVVSDAMSAAGLGPGTHRLGRWGEIEVGEDLAAWAPNKAHLLGSAMSMAQAERNLRDAIGFSDAEISRLVHDNAAALLAQTAAGATA